MGQKFNYLNLGSIVNIEVLFLTFTALEAQICITNFNFFNRFLNKK